MAKGRKFDSYRKISLKRDDVAPFLQGFLLTVVIAFLFYRHIAGLLAGILVIPFWLKLKNEEKQAEILAKKSMEFKEYMMLIVAGLQTGYSLERAVKQAEDELKKLFPEGSVILPYIRIMNQKISMNIQLEQAFDEFAKAIGLEEAVSLSEIIGFAKRSGGDYSKHIRDTALKIEENLSIKQEIETITTEKRLELKVMCVMPMGILAYISLTSKSFIAPLYGNLVGAEVMTVCLIGYGCFMMLGRKIIDIKV